MSEYLKVLLLSVTVPLACSFYPPLNFYSKSKALFKTLLWITFIFGAWDVLATSRGHWYFETHAVWMPRIINLPIEEVLFFVVIPFCCIFTWEALNYIKKNIKR
ncbi:MAG: lycopene cyclase domain-containing protein [Candidatus Omnitrophica bacterium]|nr:lycopene cyclase domain-containing protein [Candidatus Omnitrophota bacterium]